MIACGEKVLSKRNEITAKLRDKIDNIRHHLLQLLDQSVLINYILTL
jgi:hypothetical protein